MIRIPVSAGLLALALLAGCTMPMSRDRSGPPPVEVAAGEATNIRVSWGGEILRTENLAQGTRLEIVAHPLDTGAKPLTAQPEQGRFRAHTAQFLEPLDFAPGRIVSVEGWVRRVETGQVGDREYRYPVVEITKIRLWPRYMPDDGVRVQIGIGFGVGF